MTFPSFQPTMLHVYSRINPAVQTPHETQHDCINLHNNCLTTTQRHVCGKPTHNSIINLESEQTAAHHQKEVHSVQQLTLHTWSLQTSAEVSD